jgi:hypothetical protein
VCASYVHGQEVPLCTDCFFLYLDLYLEGRVLSLNLSWNIGSSDQGFLWFSSVPQADAATTISF